MNRNYLYLFSVVIFSLLVACGGQDPSSDQNDIPRIIENSDSEEKSVGKVEDKQGESSVESETPDPLPQEQIDKAKEIIAATLDAEVNAVDADKKYKMVCSSCHGFTGDLNFNGAKDLTRSKLPLEESVAQVYHGKGKMTPFKGMLSDVEIVAVCQFIEGLRK